MSEITWITNNVGYEDTSDVVTKRRLWFVRLSNKQFSRVAEVVCMIDPFPPLGESYLISERLEPYRPGIEGPVEEHAYAKAFFEAGKWAAQFHKKNNDTGRRDKIARALED